MNKNIDTLIRRLDNNFVKCCKCKEYHLKKESTQYFYHTFSNPSYNEYECNQCTELKHNMRKIHIADKVITNGKIIKNRYGPINQ